MGTDSYFVLINDISKNLYATNNKLIDSKVLICANFKSKRNSSSEILNIINFFGNSRLFNRSGSKYSTLLKYCKKNNIKLLVVITASHNHLPVVLLISVKEKVSVLFKYHKK